MSDFRLVSPIPVTAVSSNVPHTILGLRETTVFANQMPLLVSEEWRRGSRGKTTSNAGVSHKPVTIDISELHAEAYANCRIGAMSLTDNASSPTQVVSVAMKVGHHASCRARAM